MLHASPVTKIFSLLIDKRLLFTLINPFSFLLRLLFNSQDSILAPVEIKLKSQSILSPLFKVKYFADIELTDIEKKDD